MVQISNGISNPEAQTFEIQPSKSPDFKWFRISNGQISESLCSMEKVIVEEIIFLLGSK